MNKKMLVFAPHPDDETLGCGGTIAKKTSEGYEAFVVVLTDGRHAFSKILGIHSDPNPKEMKQIRKEEVIKATRVLGVPTTNLIFLNFEDGALRESEEEAEEKIIEVLRKYLPLEVYIPSFRDGHTDHQAANRIIRKCLTKLGSASAIYQYSIKYKYPRIEPLIERLLDLFRNDIIEVDISGYVDLKQKAIEEFKSQILLISSKQEKPVLKKVDRYLGTRERFHIVSAR